MPGYSLDQLEARSANLRDYIGCLNCRLHWHRRSFENHLRVSSGTPRRERPVAIVHPAWERFIDFLVEGAIKQWMKDHADGRRGGDPAAEAVPDSRPPTKRQVGGEYETITVDEAVARFGLSREEIMADFERNRIPFEVELRSPPSRRGRRPRTA